MEKVNNNVIGYKGTPEERLENWRFMLANKEAYRRLKNNTDDKIKAIADKDLERFNYWLKEYTKDVA